LVSLVTLALQVSDIIFSSLGFLIHFLYKIDFYIENNLLINILKFTLVYLVN